MKSRLISIFYGCIGCCKCIGHLGKSSCRCYKNKRTSYILSSVRVEGRNRSRKYHVTVSPNKQQNVIRSGYVTKIELELEEAPDDVIVVGSMPPVLDDAGENNSTYSDGIPGTGAVIVRAEEALIVILVLLLWAAAIALFFNRWGKIRMLEPYQPKFQQQQRQSCTTIEQNQLQTRRTFSKCNILCGDYPTNLDFNCGAGQARPRQNSVFIGSGASLLPNGQGTPRRTKSAFDLQFLILSENDSRDSCTEQDASKTLKPLSESTKLLQRERRISVCQSDRTETAKAPFRDRGMSVCHFDASASKTWQRDRGMSICQFDRTDVLARPLQRDRGGSICLFDRMDVLARPLQRDRTSSAYHFDRTDVFARPNYSLGKSLLRERRVSMGNFLERDEEAVGYGRRERRSSVSNIGKQENGNSPIEKAGCSGEREIYARCVADESTDITYHYDQPCCSKTADIVYGYKATCV